MAFPVRDGEQDQHSILNCLCLLNGVKLNPLSQDSILTLILLGALSVFYCRKT